MESKQVKTAEQLIVETEQKLTQVLNESMLTPGILELILRNIYSQVRDAALAMSKGETPDNVVPIDKEKEDG